MITIKNWETEEVIYTSDKETTREAVEEAVSKGISLAYADLRGRNLYKVNLYKVDLSYANLSYTNLSYVDFSGANLRKVNFNHTNLYGAIIDKDVDIRKLLNIKK